MITMQILGTIVIRGKDLIQNNIEFISSTHNT